MRRIREQDLQIISDILRYGDHNPIVSSHSNGWMRRTDWAIRCMKCRANKIFHIKEEQMTKTDAVEVIINQFTRWKMQWPESCPETTRIRIVEEVMEL